MPSIHTCYSLIIAITCFYLVTRKPVRFALPAVLPGLIIFSIVATGNHFWIDAILGALTAAVALGCAWVIERYHPTLPDSARLRLHLRPVGPSSPKAARGDSAPCVVWLDEGR